MNYATLIAELTDDPLVRGYAGMSDEEAATSLNVIDRQVNVESVTGQEIFEAVVPSEYNALADKQTRLLHAIIGMGTILVNGTNTKAALVAMFQGTNTLTNLAALQKRNVSRAEELDLGTVWPGNIEEVRRNV